MVFRNQIDHIQHGAAGTSSVVRTPDSQLESNILHLKQQYDDAALGQAIYHRDARLEASVKVGQPVYWNATNNQYELALAAVEASGASWVIMDSADCVGIVANKDTSTQGDVLTWGIDTIDISEAVDGVVAAGRYYLSAATAGKLVQQRPGITVFVLRNYGDGTVGVHPDVKDFLEDHIHYSVDLVALPAGDCDIVSEGSTHAVTTPNVALPGWLPADHASFGGTAPAGAKFGYNMAAHSALQSLWPPLPIGAVLLEMQRSSTDPMLQQILGRVNSNFVTFDINGIWWMSDCYGQAPWPVDCGTTSSASSLSCNTVPTMSLILSFIKQTFTG